MALTWLFVYGQHANPGQRYGLLSATCGGQYVAAYDLAEGTADRNGDLTIVAPDLDINPRAPDVWILVYRWADGAPLGGVQGPLTGHGARLSSARFSPDGTCVITASEDFTARLWDLT